MNEKQIGRLLRSKRERCSFTKKQLAEKIGVSESTIYNIEHGKNPTLSNIIAYAKCVDAYVAILDWIISEKAH